MIRYWVEVAGSGFPFACTAVVQHAGKHMRCGRPTRLVQHVGGNGMAYPVCEYHAKGLQE